MRIKSYFADSVAEAMEKARRELGPDCMLLNSKKTDLELRSLGPYEVIFGVPPEPQAAAGAEVPALAGFAAALRAAPEARPAANEFARELAELRRQIETVKRSVERRPLAAQGLGAPLGEDAAELAARLAGADMSDECAAELVSAAEKRRAAEGSAEPLAAAWLAECAARLRLAPTLGDGGEGPRAVLLSGPAGTGKTTTLIKLAIRYGLRARLPLQILSLDSLRVGGWEQLAAYARIAGLPCELLHTPEALDRALSEYRHKKLLLIDTPGFSPASDAQSRGLAHWIAAQRGRVEVQLVLSAAAQPRANLRALERYAGLTPAKVIFSHLDEAASPGPLLETALRAALPVSFLADGQQVPEDLHEASLDLLMGTLAADSGESVRFASAA